MATVQIYGTLPGGGGGTGNYNDLENKPSINGVTLAGNKTTSDLGLAQPQEDIVLDGDISWISGGTFTFEDAEDIAKLEHYKELEIAGAHPRFGFTLELYGTVSTAVQEADYTYVDDTTFNATFTVNFASNGLLGIVLTKEDSSWSMTISALGGGGGTTITYGTEDLTPGVSELEEGTLYFVYE